MTTLEVCRAAAKSPRMPKFTHAVPVVVDPATGVWDQNEPHHVNWWPLAQANPLTMLGTVEEL
jgi:hypothetical protein